ncbi:hypothetical protein GHT06_020639 [Daphnia sinensis]|uniref:Ribosomal RNA large subunit methyltransferase K/L-like methyltransferase domain-containing protein n=1 Tax=Daphnia sinensis TaxID=1820382 RepID=A0AAD5KIP7_9CRUS|nr:hypothetical protein GHT06_020639 [Daphnia sinensis]
MPDYFCTVGFGLNEFAVLELEALPTVTVQKTLTGKVFFQSDRNAASLLALKTVERIFVNVIHDEVEPNLINSFDDWLTNKLCSKSSSLNESLFTWKEFAKRTSDDPIKFRINARLSGIFRKSSLFQRASSLAGNIFQQNSSLVKDLHEPDLDVFLHLNDNFLTVGLQLTKKPLSDRCYLDHIAVRSTVCVAMCMAVGLSSDDVLLDPMCGAATILVEAVKQFDCKAAVGVDCDLLQLKLARANLNTSLSNSQIELICGDSRIIFLKQQQFDVVLCDVPFGRKFGVPTEIHRLLTSVVNTIDAVLKPKGRIGILISENEHQGELSLIEMMENLKVPGGRRTPDRSVQSTHSSPASIAIALSEEQHRRQECEKVIQQLQTHISTLQQEHAVAKAALQRKDSLLMQAQQQWKTVESDWNQRLSLANEEKDHLTTTVARLEGQVQISIAEARKKTTELQAVVRQNDEILRNLREENANLKEKHEQSQYQLKEITIQLEDSKKEVKQNENKIDDLKRENHRLKSQIEDLKREKERSVVELELLQQRFEASQEQHENYSQVRIKEATKNAEEEANRRLQIWQNEVESKMSHLITTLEHQLGILKAKSLEESQAREARHQEEMKAMRAQCTTLLQQVKHQKKEHDELTRKMRQLAEAQWNTVNKITPSSGGRQTAPSIVASEISDATLLTSDSTNTNVLVIQDEFRKHGAQPSSKDSKERSEPTSRRTK